MSRSKSLALSMVFLAIAAFVSGSLVLSVREGYASNGSPATFRDAVHLLHQDT